MHPIKSVSLYSRPMTSYRWFSSLPDSPAKAALQTLVDSKGQSIIDAGLVYSIEQKGESEVAVKIMLTKDFRKQKAAIQDHLKNQMPGVKVNVSIAPQEVKSGDSQQVNPRLAGLKDVKNILAVSSCKGGVGKSTVAVNLAYSLASLGLKIGIFDADIYGPSLPTMIKPHSTDIYTDEDDPSKIMPLEFADVKAMSYGFAAQNKAAIMRGPMVSNLVSQLVGQTKWGSLDYLVIDFPPGTGDIQLTLAQELKLKAAVIVTTPQLLAYEDVNKGIAMFDDLKVPTIAVVENMSYFQCTNCEEKHRIYGKGYTDYLVKNYGIKNSFEVPILKEVSHMSDQGTPFVLALPEEVPIVSLYKEIAKKVDQEVRDLKPLNKDCKYDPTKGKVILSEDGSIVKEIDPYKLRLACKCALCVDEVDGRQILQVDKVPKDVYPTNMIKKGNYAVAVVWSDGHRSSLYPYTSLFEM